MYLITLHHFTHPQPSRLATFNSYDSQHFPTEIIITTANAFTQFEIYVQSLSGGRSHSVQVNSLKADALQALDQKKEIQINLSFSFPLSALYSLICSLLFCLLNILDEVEVRSRQKLLKLLFSQFYLASKQKVCD